MRESCGGRRVTGDLVKMEVGRRRRESFGARSFCRIQNLPESGLGFGCKTLVIESVGGLAEADFLNWKSFPDFMNSFLLFLLWFNCDVYVWICARLCLEQKGISWHTIKI